MTTWFISRHSGAIAWARGQGLPIDRWQAHLDMADVAAGDTVIGSLPVHVAAQVCERGARYLHLRVDLPASARGQELTADELDAFGARLEVFRVSNEGEP